MADPFKENLCCCGMFYITSGVFLIVGHSFLHATYGILLVITSYYINKNNVINMMAVGANVSMFPAGIVVFGTALYNNYHAASFAAFFFTIVTAINFAAEISYLIWYLNFEANSHLDKILFWRDDEDWISPGEVPFTMWHVLTFSFIVVLLSWWYFSFMLWKYAKLLKMKDEYNSDLPVSEHASFTDRMPLKKVTL